MTSNNALKLDDNVLDRLEELSIINIDSDEDDSPSFGTASLPTPEPPRVDFRMIGKPWPQCQEFELWIEGEEQGRSLDKLQVPGAPMMKDMDSFTDGTGCGSFDGLPGTATNELGGLIYPATDETITLLPPADSRHEYIIEWLTGVEEPVVTPSKRRREASPEDEEQHCPRRTRPRIRAQSLPPDFRPYTQCLGFSTTFSEPDAPD